MKNIKEEWKIIEGYTKYSVSNLGRVKRNTCITTDSAGRVYQIKEKYLSIKSAIDRRNNRPYYVRVSLIGDNGISKAIGVHRLVALAFIPNPDNKSEVNHIDQVRDNNRVDNLEWVTKEENLKKCVIKGKLGSSNNNAKLNENDVSIICGLLVKGKESASIGRIFDVTKECIDLIKYKKNWSHLECVKNLPNFVPKNPIKYNKDIIDHINLLFESNLTDTEIACEVNISRRYINELRHKFYNK